MQKCLSFLVQQKLIQKGELFFTDNPSPNTPLLIAAWIMHKLVLLHPNLGINLLLWDRCDEINLDGSPKHSEVLRDTYTHAQKMRASMTYAFGRLCGIGPIPWHKSEVTGKMVGNPSVSDTVASFMVSLRRRKVRAGEVQTSARAITSV